MFEAILRRIRQRIRQGRYVMTLHAEEEMDEDNLSLLDIEHVVLTGSLLQRKRDRKTREWKYLIEGRTTGETRAAVIGKLSPTGTVVIITVYAEEA